MNKEYIIRLLLIIVENYVYIMVIYNYKSYILKYNNKNRLHYIKIYLGSNIYIY